MNKVYIVEQSVLALLQNHVLTPTSNFETFHCFETREKNIKFLSGCLGYQEFWFHNSNILRGSEILNTLLYCLGNQKFWMLFCVLGGSEILNPLLCYLGDQKFWISCVVLGIRNSESSPVLLGDQKLWILSCVILGDQKF